MKGPGEGPLERLRGRDSDAETDEEIRFHREMRIRDYERRGLSEAEAREAAERRLGDVDAAREACRRIDRAGERRAALGRWLADARQDLRYAWRMLLRSPVFSLMAVLTLAVGIGATAAIAGVARAVLVTPLPYAHPDRLVRLWETTPRGEERNVVSPGNVVDWRERATSFSALGAFSYPFGVTLTEAGAEPARVTVARLQPDALRALGVPPAIGRGFDARDAAEGGVALLAHDFWRTRYGSDPGVLGRTLALNDAAFTVVGVMPPGFRFVGDGVQAWTPLTDAALDPTERRSHNYHVVGLLAPGATVESARSEMDAVAAGIAREHPEHMTGWGASVVPFHEDMTAHVRPLMGVLLGGVAVVLLIACGNLANLLLARAVGREREIALRGALGAGRRRTVRQLFTESALLAALGAAGAALLAPAILRGLVAMAPPDVPLVDRAGVDPALLALTGVLALGCALLFGLAPAAHATGADARAALAGSRGGTRRSSARLREALLVGQVALSVVLLVGVGLFVRSFVELSRTDLGFDERGLVVMQVDLPRSRYPDTGTQAGFYRRLRERIADLPGVAAVAQSSEVPGSDNSMTFSFAIEGRTATNASGREDDERLRAVAGGYFEALGQRVVRGRTFDDRDGEDSPPVVIINRSLERKHWPDGGAVGSHIAFRVGETPWREIVGVVEDARVGGPDREPGPALYIPFDQKRWDWLTWSGVVARTPGGADPAAVQSAMRAALLEFDGALLPQSLTTVEASFREGLARRRFALTLVGAFGAVALLLSVLGLYGVTSWSVARRRREIGVRIALGAPSGEVVRGVLARAVALTAAGALLGVVAAVGATRALESLLFGVATVDPATYGAVVALVSAVATLTAAVPAWRAARTDPVEALAGE